MSLFLDDGDVRLYHGDALETLQTLPSGSVHCCVTSPPFYGLRDYGTGRWDGGDPDCDHLRQSEVSRQSSGLDGATETQGGTYAWRDVCGKCGARRVDQQIGLESTPEEWVESLVQVFREVRRVLRPEGTLWLEIGDSYNSGTGAARQSSDANHGAWQLGSSAGHQRMNVPGCKPKDLIGAPWMLAFALRADGWYLRSDIVWARPNPMPESVTDRPTKAHSYVFLLAKQPRYFFDQEAVRELTGTELSWDEYEQRRKGWLPPETNADGVLTSHAGTNKSDGGRAHPNGRNVRSVWNIATQPYPEAHFATFPEELARRCILAGTSERGCCPECGAPWVREVERGELVPDVHGGSVNRGVPVDEALVNRWNHGQENYGPNMRREVTTLGWRPSCDHYEGRNNERPEVVAPDDWRLAGTEAAARTEDSASLAVAAVSTETAKAASAKAGATPDWQPPCVVLDPFVGSGTVPHVARKHGRQAIGIDLNAAYLELAARRLQQLSLFAQVTP